jgi:hypothetical protein
MDQHDLKKEICDNILKANFNIFEMQGFKQNPALALQAGAAIGYRLALEHFSEYLVGRRRREEAEGCE